MIEKLRAEGHSASEIVNFLILGYPIEPKSKPRWSKQGLKKSTERVVARLYDTDSEPNANRNHQPFNPTTEEIERGKELFRNSRAEAILHSSIDASVERSDTDHSDEQPAQHSVDNNGDQTIVQGLT